MRLRNPSKELGVNIHRFMNEVEQTQQLGMHVRALR